jgi:hypothetical protein
MFRPGGTGRGALRRKKDADPPEHGKSPTALGGLPDGIFGVSRMDKHPWPRDCGGRGKMRDEVRPEIEATGWFVYPALLEQSCGVKLVPGPSE